MNHGSRTFLFISLLTLGNSGCVLHEETAASADVNQSRIWQTYSVRHVGEEARTDATAQFRFEGSNGTTLQLTSPSVVRHNGRIMTGYENTLFGGFSYTDGQNGFVAGHEFVFTDHDGRTFTQAVSIPLLAFVQPPSVLSMNAPVSVIEFTGDEVAPGETIQLRISDAGGGASRTLTSWTTVGGTRRFELYPSTFAGMAPGTKILRLSRSKSLSLQQANPVGGSIDVQNDAAPVSVQLTH